MYIHAAIATSLGPRLIADYQAYIDCQDRVGETYANPSQWSRMSILNSARMGTFSSDRSIRDYAENIWQTQPVPVVVANYVQANAGLRVARP